MSELLQQSIKSYPFCKTFESYRGAARVEVYGNGQTVTIFKRINGVRIPVKTGVASCIPPLVLEVGLGATVEYDVEITGTNGDCAQLSVIDTNYVITPPLDPEELASLITVPIVEAIGAQTTDLEAAIQAQTISITASLQAIVDTLDAGIDVNATQVGTWTVTIDNQPLDVTLNAQTIADLITAIEAADVTVTVGGQDVTLDVAITGQPIAVTVDLSPIVGAIESIVRVDYEKTRFCILDASGDRVPLTGVYAELRYDHAGVVISSQTVLSELVGTAWQSYTLGAGETVGECPDGGTQEVSVVSPVQIDQTQVIREHVRVTGTGDIPGGLKTVTIKALTGSGSIVDFPLEAGETYNESASEIDYVTATLPAMTLPAGLTWAWIGLQPVVEES